jgi:hypothetical protein
MKKYLSALIVASLAGSLPALAQEQVLPLGYDNTPGGTSFLSQLANSPRTYQMLLHEDQLTTLVGSELTGIAFRNSATITTSWPATEVTYPDYQIYLSPSVPPADRQLDFAANVAGPQLQVRSGPLVIQPDVYTFGSSPNAFGPTIEFTQPYPYQGGHLIIELRHTGSNSSTSRGVDAIGTSNPGYLNQFSACWQGTGGVLQGNFSIVQVSFQAGGPVCYADCDSNETLNLDDFLCFINEFAQAQFLPPSQQQTHYANCTGATAEPYLSIDDFICFINEFSQGCP